MGALFSRIKVWRKERLKYADLNREFDNILSNAQANKLGGFSTTVGEMQTTTSPVDVSGNPSLASSIADELARLRYMFQKIVGGAQWYTDPGRVFAALPDDLVTGLPMDGIDQLAAYADLIGRGAVINAASLSTADVLQTHFDTVNKKFGQSSYGLGAGRILAFPGKVDNIGTLSAHFRNLSAGDYIAYNPLLGLELYLNGSGFLVAKLTKQTATADGAKSFTTVVGSVSRAGVVTWQHATLKWATNLIAGSDLLQVMRDVVDEAAPDTSASVVSPGQGGMWFFGAKRNDPTWDAYAAMFSEPSADTVPWSGGGLGTHGAPVDGQISIQNYGYSRTANVNLASMTVEFKVKCPDDAQGQLTITDTSMNVGLVLSFAANKLKLHNTGSTGTATETREIALDMTEFNVIRVTSSGSPAPTVKVYVNGVLVMQLDLVFFASGGDLIRFEALTSVALLVFEHFAYFGAGALPPVSADASGNLDDIVITKSNLPDVVLNSLESNNYRTVFGVDKIYGPWLAYPIKAAFNGNIAADYSTGDMIQTAVYVACDGKTETIVALNGVGTAAVADTVMLAMFQDDIFNLSSHGGVYDIVPFSAANGFSAFSAQARMLKSVGLHKLSVKNGFGPAGLPSSLIANMSINLWRE